MSAEIVKSTPEKNRLLVGCTVVAALLGVLFWPTFSQLYQLWSIDPSYSHGFVILPMSIAIAWWIFQRKAGIPAQGELVLGVPTILAGCLLHLSAQVVRWPLIDFVALVLVLRGVAVTMGSRKWASKFWFPILFLFFMFPLPPAWTSAAALWLQDIVASASANVLELFTVCYRRGTALYLPGVQGAIYVAPQCSGIRQIVVFLGLGVFLSWLDGNLFKWPPLVRFVFVLSAIPVAIAANIARVIVMALGIQLFGNSWAATWMHDIPALITLPFGLVLFLLIGLALHRFCVRTYRHCSRHTPCAVASDTAHGVRLLLKHRADLEQKEETNGVAQKTPFDCL